jgi:hypothetical protein
MVSARAAVSDHRRTADGTLGNSGQPVPRFQASRRAPPQLGAIGACVRLSRRRKAPMRRVPLGISHDAPQRLRHPQPFRLRPPLVFDVWSVNDGRDAAPSRVRLVDPVDDRETQTSFTNAELWMEAWRRYNGGWAGTPIQRTGPTGGGMDSSSGGMRIREWLREDGGKDRRPSARRKSAAGMARVGEESRAQQAERAEEVVQRLRLPPPSPSLFSRSIMSS